MSKGSRPLRTTILLNTVREPIRYFITFSLCGPQCYSTQCWAATLVSRSTECTCSTTDFILYFAFIDPTLFRYVELRIHIRCNYITLTSFVCFQAVLTSKKMLTKGRQYRFFHNWLGTGLLTRYFVKVVLYRVLQMSSYICRLVPRLGV